MFPIFQTLPFFLFHFLILVTSIFHSFPSLIPFCPFLFTHSFLSIPFHSFLFSHSFSPIPFLPFLFSHSFVLCQPSDILDSSRSTTAKKDEAFMMHINTSRKFDSPSSGRKTFATPDSKKSDSRCNDYYISIYMKYC